MASFKLDFDISSQPKPLSSKPSALSAPITSSVVAGAGQAIKQPIKTAKAIGGGIKSAAKATKGFVMDWGAKNAAEQAQAKNPLDKFRIQAKQGVGVAMVVPKEILAWASLLTKTVTKTALPDAPNMFRSDQAQSDMEKRLLGREIGTLQSTYVDPTLKFAEEKGSGGVEKYTLGALAGLGGFVLETPVGSPAKKPTVAALSKLADEIAKTNNVVSIEKTITQSFPDIKPEVRRRLSEFLTKETDSTVVGPVLRDFVDQQRRETVYRPARIEESIKKQTENLPPPKPGETPIFFYRAGGNQQFVTTDLDLAKQFAPTSNGVVSKPFTVANVPTSLLKVIEDKPKVFTIPDELAFRLDSERILLERIKSAVPKTNIAKTLDTTPAPSAKSQLDMNIKDVKTSTPLQRQIETNIKPSSPSATIRSTERKILKDRLALLQSVSRRAAVATRRDVKSIQDDIVKLLGNLPLKERGKFIATVKNIQTPSELKRSLPDIERRVNEALDRVEVQNQTKQLRKQVGEMIKQKELKNTEAFRKAMKLPSLKSMTVDDLRTFSRALAPFKPGDKFLSQRVLETIDRTPASGMRTYREAQVKIAKEAGVPIEKLQSIQTSWYDKFLYDSALAEQNPFYNVMVKKINGSILQGNVRFAEFEEQLDVLLKEARDSRKRSLADRAIPTDDMIFKYMEAPDKSALVEQMTPAELKAANFLSEKYLDARDYLLKEQVMNKYVEDYVTHVRRTGLEAFKEDGLVAAIRETFEQYRIDQANFLPLNEKTGDVLPMEKFFAFAQKRTGGLKPTQNIARASKSYFMALERKRALDAIVPELNAYVQSITPMKKTPKGLDYDPRFKTFFKTYMNTKRGRPASLILNPGTPPDVIARGIVSFTRLIDLGMSIPNFAAAQIGEQAVEFIQSGTKQYALGIARQNTKQGKAIIEKYRGFVGRSPWKEISDTSKNFPDKAQSALLSGFHLASVQANKQGLLARLTKEEFKSGTISPERLSEMRLDIGRWRALDNSASIVGSTAEGAIFKQYKAWAVPPMTSTVRNLGEILKSTRRGENPFKTRAMAETLRTAVLTGSVALTIYALNQEEDESFIGEITSKSIREALSAVGALDPELWISTPRAWQYIQNLYEALETLVLLEEYKTGEKAGTLKGDDQLLRLITPAPVRQINRDLNQRNTNTPGESSGFNGGYQLDFDLDTPGLSSGAGFQLDFDL